MGFHLNLSEALGAWPFSGSPPTPRQYSRVRNGIQGSFSVPTLLYHLLSAFSSLFFFFGVAPGLPSTLGAGGIRGQRGGERRTRTH